MYLLYADILMAYSIISRYWHFAARAVVVSKISFLLSVYVRPVAVGGATWVRMSEGSSGRGYLGQDVRRIHVHYILLVGVHK